MSQAVTPVIQGNLEVIDQCISVLSSVNDSQYIYVDPPNITSAIGTHFRHILDIYRALMEGVLSCQHYDSSEACVNYDRRRRGASCESQLSVARAELIALKRWLLGFSIEHCRSKVWIKTEVSIGHQESQKLASNVLRELVFASSHAVHHLAVVAMIARFQGINVDALLGLAPATANYLREGA